MTPASLPGPAQDALAAFATTFTGDPEGVWFAPGRVNLIGEHTDYNDGFVLPLALTFGVGVAASRRTDRIVRVTSLQADAPVEFSLDGLAPGSVDGWGAYVAGVAWALIGDGVALTGADLVLASDVPPGAGLSSSHALECGVALALLGLAGEDRDRTDLALLVRRAENEFVGAPTGIMDQMASLHGVAAHALLIDTRAQVVQPVPWALAAVDLALLVIDTRTPHALVSGEYAERRDSCHLGARTLGVEALRDVGLDDLEASLVRLDDPMVARRVRHVVTENARVLDVVNALSNGEDPRAIGPLLTASHASMRDDFEITVPTVDTAVEAALAAGAHGARMTGGGFGGCVIALVEADAVEAVATAVETAFAAQGFGAPHCFVAEAAAGARRLR